jgi:hypothetical protein
MSVCRSLPFPEGEMAAPEGFPYTAKAYTIDERACENIRAA